ncbi:MAG: Antigen TpF1 [Chlamydiae bacterium]|nr:Antigen TpF1 [Chlamydiota bacterium]
MSKKTLDEAQIKTICEKLSHYLADTFVLYVKTLNYHWNMVGSQFFMYHKLLQEQYEEMAQATDELAERIRMLGHPAPGTLAQFQKLSCIEESDKIPTQEEMIRELAKIHEMLVEHGHQTIAFTDQVLDQGTSDLLVERIRFHDKQAWLLRSHFSHSG